MTMPADDQEKNTEDATPTPHDQGRRARAARSLSMHDGVPVWCDCCSCEAEPYWVEAMGMDPGSNDEQPAR